jgi:hypothetical protein
MNVFLCRLRDLAQHFLVLAILPGAFCLSALPGVWDQAIPGKTAGGKADHGPICSACRYPKEMVWARGDSMGLQAGMPQTPRIEPSLAETSVEERHGQ